LNNSKGKKEVITKKWCNVNMSNLNTNANSNKENKKEKEAARKTHNHLNFAVNLINIIKINFKITENYDINNNNFNKSLNTSKQNIENRKNSFGGN
jgi:hypothetical protein